MKALLAHGWHLLLHISSQGIEITLLLAFISPNVSRDRFGSLSVAQVSMLYRRGSHHVCYSGIQLEWSELHLILPIAAL